MKIGSQRLVDGLDGWEVGSDEVGNSLLVGLVVGLRLE